MKLYSYWRSTTSYRVRAVLNLKGVSYDTIPVNLVEGAQREADYTALNPGAGVPTLVLEDGTVLTQSLAIIDYLDATYREPPMLPDDAVRRSQVLAAALTVATDVHPVNNLRVIAQLRGRFGASPDQTQDWMVHWMTEGFAALERMLPDKAGFAFGDAPDLADICITSQCYNAHRWGVDLNRYPKVARIEAACLAVPQIADAHPDRQPDAA
ncbi:MAG: maleylacetoacetate isomerase [Sulfitobacter sp.]|nr:maleylacetoacetate isomerase [Sulfitobacter sp.]